MTRRSAFALTSLMVAIGFGCSDPVEPEDPALLPGPTPAAVLGAYGGEAEDSTGVVTYLGLAIEVVGIPGTDGTFAIAGTFGLDFTATTVGGHGSVVGTVKGRRVVLTLATTEAGCGVVKAIGTIDSSALELALPLEAVSGTCYEEGAVLTLRRCPSLDPDSPAFCDPTLAQRRSSGM